MHFTAQLNRDNPKIGFIKYDPRSRVVKPTNALGRSNNYDKHWIVAIRPTATT